MALYFGTAGHDIYTPGDSGDVIFGLEGDDVIATGAGLDIAIGGIGDDILTAGSGTNILIGGADADLFVFAADASGTTYVGDFEDGLDRIDLSALGITGLADMDMVINSRGAVLTIGGLKLDIRTDPATLGAEDFIFAEDPAAIVLGFEDLAFADGSTGEIDGEYAGFTWSNFAVMEYDEYGSGTVSGHRPAGGDNFAFNLHGAPATIYRETAFDLETISLSAAWSDGLEVTVEGYSDGELVGRQVLSAGYGAVSHHDLDDAIFDSVTLVRFSAAGGTDVAGDAGAGTHFTLDDLTYVG